MKRLLAIALTIGLSLVASGCTSKSVDVNELYDVIVTGANGYASAAVDADLFYQVSFYEESEEVSDELSLENILKTLEKTAIQSEFFDSINVIADGPTDNLSNGDVVKYKVNCNEDKAKEAGLKLSKDTIEHKVEGLEDAIVYDIFHDLEITYAGLDGDGSVESLRNYDLPFSVNYTASKSYGLSNGDRITVSASLSESEALRKGYVVDVESMDYEVFGLRELEVIDAFDGVKITFEGVDGEGSVKWSVPDLPVYLDYYLSEESGLSNGDIVTLSIHYSDTQARYEGYRILEDSIDYEVSGLTVLEAFDTSQLEEYVSLRFSGASPRLSVSLENNLPGEYKNLFSYYTDAEATYKFGDEVSIQIQYDDEALKKAGYSIDKEEPMFALPVEAGSAPHYLQDIKEITKTDREAIVQQITDGMTSLIGVKPGEKFRSGYRLNKGVSHVFLLTVKPAMINNVSSDGPMSRLVFLYEVEETDDGTAFYYSWVMNDIVVELESNAHVELSKIFNLDSYERNMQSTKSDYVNAYADNYDIREYSIEEFLNN